MRESAESLMEFGGLEDLIGGVVESVYRVVFVHAGRVVDGEGGVGLVFESGSVYAECGGDGQTLELSAEWVDPFAGSLDRDTQDWLSTNGRWQRRDLDDCELIGRRLEAIRGPDRLELASELSLTFDEAMVATVVAQFDETRLILAPACS